MIRKKPTIFTGILILLTGAFLLGNLSVLAQNRSSGDLKVSGGTYGKDYRYEEHTLVILTDTALTISGESRKDRIQVKSGTDARITLKNVDIRVSGCALDAGSETAVIKLSGTNYLKSGAKYPGILVPEGTSAEISGGKKDSLTVFGGSQAAGIGSEKDKAFGEIKITGGTVTATGGAKAAGIGNGFQGSGGRIRLEGGRVSAYGGAGAADLGCPQEGNGMAGITLSGNGILSAAEVIGSSSYEEGILFTEKSGVVYGSVILSYPLEIASGQTFTIPPESSLEIPADIKCVNKGDLYVYGTVKTAGTFDNKGQIYDYGEQLADEAGITGNPVVSRDIRDIYLVNGSIRFTKEGYEQSGMLFPDDSGFGSYTIFGEGEESTASIDVEAGLSLTCTLKEALLNPEEGKSALTLGEGASVELILEGENRFGGDGGGATDRIVLNKDADLELSGSGILALEGGNGSRLVLQGTAGASAASASEEEDADDVDGEGQPAEDVSADKEVRTIPVDETENIMEAVLTHDMLEQMTEEKQDIAMEGRMVQIAMDWRAVRELYRETRGDVTIRVRPFTIGPAFPLAAQYIADRPVYDIQIVEKDGGKETVRSVSFEEGTVQLMIPYSKPSAEDARKLYLVYVGADNTLDWIKNSYYDAGKERMVSEVRHFSVYGIGSQAAPAAVSGNGV